MTGSSRESGEAVSPFSSALFFPGAAASVFAGELESGPVAVKHGQHGGVGDNHGGVNVMDRFNSARPSICRQQGY